MYNSQTITSTRNRFILILFSFIALFLQALVAIQDLLKKIRKNAEMSHDKLIHPAAHFWWGQTGHRVTGWIAQDLLSPQAQRAVERILEGNSLAEVSTWMDEVRSDPSFDYMGPWHCVNHSARSNV